MFDKNNALNLINQARSKANIGVVAGFVSRKKRAVTVVAAMLAVLGVGYIGFHLYQKSAQEKYSAIFHQALLEEERGNLQGAKEGMLVVYNAKFAPSGVKSLTSLRYAGLLLNEGSYDDALKIYQEITDNGRYDRYIRELSGLLATKILVIKSGSNVDKAAQEATLKQVDKIESYAKILRPFIAEQKGILEMKFGNLDKSYAIFAQIISDQNSEQSLKMRVSDIMKSLVAQGYEVKTPIKKTDK